MFRCQTCFLSSFSFLVSTGQLCGTVFWLHLISEKEDFYSLPHLLSYQDCKNFQGELFGICNLFRDLSDRLFTSEIIEPQKKQGQKRGNDSDGKDKSAEHGTHFVYSEEGLAGTSNPEIQECNSLEKVTTKEPVLKELGKILRCFLG